MTRNIRPPTAIDEPTTPKETSLNQKKYDFRYLVFPNDLGMDSLSHYMVININAPTKLASREYAGNYKDQFTKLEPDTRSKVDTLRGYTGVSPIAPGGTSGETGILGIPRQTRRIVESIAMFMPTPMVYNTQNIYEEVSLTALAGKLGIAAVAKRILPRRVADAIGSGVTTAAAVAQTPINPAVEILFTNTPVRQFTFELLMAPRNEKESETLRAIIKTLRFHAAPEINTNTLGLMWIPPAEFDITFYSKGVENLNIMRINTCVLERIEVDYAPAGGVYATFRNGHPVAVRLSLGFREVEPIHKLRVLQNF